MSDITIVVLDGDYDDERLAATLAPGVAVTFDLHPSVFVLNDGDVDELAPDEHPDYVELGTVHGRPALPDEDDIDDDDFLEGWLGRIGDVYFFHRKDPWAWESLGQLDTDDDAVDMACGAEFDFRP
jgi:hypothetical protein